MSDLLTHAKLTLTINTQTHGHIVGEDQVEGSEMNINNLRDGRQRRQEPPDV